MQIEFLPEALEELKDAANYYADISPRLEQTLLNSVERAVDLIIYHPLAWHQIQANIRRKLVERFPYELLYTIQKDKVLILAVMHQHQKPRDWSARL